MKGSRKKTEPIEFLNWLAQANPDWQPSYQELSGEPRASVLAALFSEQRGLCVYCGRRLDLSRMGETTHVEHFRPQSRFPYHQLSYANLFLSCGLQDQFGAPSGTCGNRKADEFDQQEHIYPSYPSCTDRFRFDLNGNVFPAYAGDTAAERMIEDLGLQHPELVREREEFLFLLDADEVSFDELFDPASGTADGLAHVAYRRAGLSMP